MWHNVVMGGLSKRIAFTACLFFTFGSALPSLCAQTSSVLSGEVAAERLLLLQNGKVVKGITRKSAAGYVVNVTGGQLVLPVDQVRLEATDLEDAYRQQRDTLPTHNAATHIELARWCVSNGLPDCACKELRTALRCEPDSTIAKNMLQRINDQLLTTKDVPAVAVRNGQFSMLGDAKPGIVPEALGGLPREAAADFVAKVQPLLVNRCATAGCHGPGSGSTFELQRAKIGKGPPKIYSERNLIAVLERLDLERPLSSPLLVKLHGDSNSLGSRQSHGGLTLEQQQTLRVWIESIAKKPAPLAKPAVTEADDDSTTEVSGTRGSSKGVIDRLDGLPDDDLRADDNFFRNLLRDIREDRSKPKEVRHSTSDE